MAKLISAHEVAKHNSLDDLWLVVEGNVYDMTEFAPQHPGGAAIILRHAGRDASAAYSEVHPISTIETGLPASKKLGPCDTSNPPPEWIASSKQTPEPISPAGKLPLESLINSHDFVAAASKSLTPKAWAFYSSAATDTLTKERNNSAYNDITLRPRVMVNVRDMDSSTTILGQKIATPIFCAPASMVKLVHPDGEKELARGCRAANISQCVSTSASFPVGEIFGAVTSTPGGEPDIPMFFQLYVDKARHKSEKLLAEVERLGAKGIFVTVDAATAGKREADERIKADEGTVNPMSEMKAKNDKKGGALGRLMAGFIDPGLCWDDIPWLRKHTKLPICLKGVMTAMDAKRAMEAGIDGIVLSNHGGRNLDTSPAPIMVLLELQKCCPEVFDKMEIFVDGGIMRGTDIFKALCLGAKAVSIGRGFLYALNYGEEGVAKYVEILKDELEVTMKLCGVTNLSQVHPGLLNTLAIDHLIPASEEHPYAKWRPKARM